MAKIFDSVALAGAFVVFILPLHYLKVGVDQMRPNTCTSLTHRSLMLCMQPQMRLSQSVTTHLRDSIRQMQTEEKFQLEVLQNILPAEIIEQVRM